MVQQICLNGYAKYQDHKEYDIIYIINLYKSIWEVGTYTLFMDFSHDYPMKPPKCIFYFIIFFYKYL